jgi:hypothetical protein
MKEKTYNSLIQLCSFAIIFVVVWFFIGRIMDMKLDRDDAIAMKKLENIKSVTRGVKIDTTKIKYKP